MKIRIRKKAYDCSHHVYEQFLVTDDPYPIYNNEDYCKLGKFDNTWLAPEKKVNLCDTCKRFCASRPMILKQREEQARMKEFLAECKRGEKIAFKNGVLQKDSDSIFSLNDLDLPF